MAHDDVAAHLAGGLPAYYPSSPSDDNYILLEAVGEELEQQDDDIAAVQRDTTVQTAGKNDLTIDANQSQTIEEGESVEVHTTTVDGTLTVEGVLETVTLEGDGTVTGDGDVRILSPQNYSGFQALVEQSKLIGVPPRTGEGLESYRARLLAEYSTITGKATISDLVLTAARILDVRPEAITFEEPSGTERGTAQLTFPGAALDELAFNESELANILDRTIPAGYRLEALRSGTFTYITPTDYNNNLHDASLGYDGLDGNGDPKDNGGTYAGVIQ